MKLRSTLLAAIAFVIYTSAQAQAGPLSADAIMKEALQVAVKENKNVMIIFHASWCGWCHKMDTSMNDKTMKKYFDDNFVVRHMIVDESNDKKNQENPGANEFRAKYNGDQQGIPFWLVFDKKGNLLGDSQIRPDGASLDTRGDNMGCPASEKEVAAFIKLLKKTTKLSDDALAKIEKRFRQNEAH